MRGKYLLPMAVFGIAQGASAVYQITSFESTLYTPEDPAKRSVAQSTIGVTDGSFSMQINDLTGGWSWVGASYGSSVYDEFFKNTTLSLDVYFPSQNVFQQVQVAYAVNSTQGWLQKEVVGWKWLNAGEQYKATVEWDYSALIDKNKPTGTWISFNINCSIPGKGDGLSYPLPIYVDNFRLSGAPVPEPMTMIALGGGLLAVAARRRRK